MFNPESQETSPSEPALDREAILASVLETLPANDLTLPPEPYHLVSLPDYGEPSVRRYSLEGLIAALKRAGDTKRAFIFQGPRLQVTKPPFRFLLVPEMAPIPLFKAPVPDGVDESANVGRNLEDPVEDPDYVRAIAASASPPSVDGPPRIADAPLG